MSIPNYTAENKLKADDFISWEEVEWKSLLTLFLSISIKDRPQSYQIAGCLLHLPLFYASFDRIGAEYSDWDVENCEIRAAGMKYLVAAELKALRKLAVGTYLLIKASTDLMRKVSYISPLPTGPTWRS